MNSRFSPVLALLVLAPGCLTSFGGGNEEAAEHLRPVRYEVIGKSTLSSSQSFNGTVKAGSEINLSFRSGGVITQVNVEKGQRVRKGELIARLDNIEASLAYEKAVAQVKQRPINT